MRQYIALVAFSLGIISYAQHGPRPGFTPPHHSPKKVEKFHPKKKSHHTRHDKHQYRGPQKPNVVYYQPVPVYQHPPVPHQPKGVNINVAIR